MLSIGGLVLERPFILSPLAGVSDLPFRLINRKFGCELAFVEMTSARALVYGNRKTARMLSITPEDRPLGIQLLGKDPDYLRRALAGVQGHGFEVIDLNAACPVRKVTGNGEGASLLREPEKLASILRVLVSASAAPVTVKIRTGWDESSVNAVEVALRSEEAGVSAVFIHGRTRSQMYSGGVDYRTIERVKKSLSIPVIGSGDVLSPALAKKMLDETGCDAVAMARGALGNPWIFRETAWLLDHGTPAGRPGPGETASVMKEHLGMCVGFYGETQGVKVFRKFFVWYTRGFRGVKPLRERAMHACTESVMRDLTEEVSAQGSLEPDSPR